MKKTFVVILALVLVLTAFAGCKDSGTEKIGATIYRFDDNFMSYVRQNMTNIAGEMEIALDIQDSQNDQAKQGEQVDLFLSQGVAALAINLVDPQAASTIIDKAKAEDIPVVFYNKEPSAADMQSYDKCWYVGTTSSESGIIQGEMIADAWKAHPEWDTNGDGIMQYVMLKGEPGHPDAEARTTYSMAAVEEAGIQIEELAIDTAMWDPTQANDKMTAWYSQFGEQIEFVVCNNDGMAIGAINALTAEGYFSDGKFMPVVGVDAIPEALDLIEAGKLVGTVLNDALNQAKATVELTANAAKGMADPTEGTDWVLDDGKAVRVAYVGILLENIDIAKECYGIK